MCRKSFNIPHQPRAKAYRLSLRHMYVCRVAPGQGPKSHYEAQQMVLDKALNRGGHCVKRRNGPSPHNLFLLESVIPESSILFPRWSVVKSCKETELCSHASQYAECASDATAKRFGYICNVTEPETILQYLSLCCGQHRSRAQRPN